MQIRNILQEQWFLPRVLEQKTTEWWKQFILN